MPNFGTLFDIIIVMHIKMKHLLLTLLFVGISGLTFGEAQDSIKTIKEKGQTFVLHKIDKGETLYSICKRYNAKPSAALEHNPSALEVIKTGEILRIPITVVEKTEEEEKVIEVDSDNYDNIYHIVEKGETLYAISRRYKVSVDELKKMNDFDPDNLKEGQQIIVGKKAKTSEVEVGEKDTVKVFSIEESSEGEMQEVVEDIPAELEIEEVDVNQIDFENLPDGADVNESGFVRFIEDKEIDQSRNYVYHSKAKVGTIIMITNPQNNKSIFARVLGPFNVSDEKNEGIIMLITKNTAKKIGLKDKDNMLVKLNYTK